MWHLLGLRPVRQTKIAPLQILHFLHNNLVYTSMIVPQLIHRICSIFYRPKTCQRSVYHHHVSVCLSQVGVLLKWLNVGSYKQCHTIAQGFWFSNAEDLYKTQMGSSPTKVPNAGGVRQKVTGQLADTPTRGLNCQLAEWTTRGLVNLRTRQLAYWTSRGLDNSQMPLATLRAQFSFFWRHLRDRELSSPRVDQSARCPVCELAYPRVVQLPIKIGNFRETTHYNYNSKSSTVASAVNLVQSQVYHTQHSPLFAACFP